MSSVEQSNMNSARSFFFNTSVVQRSRSTFEHFFPNEFLGETDFSFPLSHALPHPDDGALKESELECAKASVTEAECVGSVEEGGMDCFCSGEK